METDKTNITMEMDMISWLDKYLKTDKAKQMGLRSRPDVFKMLLREFLNKEMPLAQTPAGKNVIIRDDKNKTFLDLDILPENEIMCNECGSKDCQHVTQVLSDKKLMKQLRKDELLS